MGIVLGLSAALWFGVGSLLIRVGMRSSPKDDGLWMTIAVNVLFLSVIGFFVSKPDWTTTGLAALVAAGFIGVVGGRSSNLRAIRHVGPTRASVFLMGTPLVAAVAGWIVLDESLGPIDALGGVLVVSGLYVLIKARSTAAAVPGTEEPKGTLVGYLYAVGAPTLFGLAFVTRKWGLQRYDSAVLAALIGAASGLLLLTLFDLVGRRVRDRLRNNFTEVNWWFVGAGGAISLALLSQFSAFSRIPAWVVGVLQGTQVLWVLLLGYLFLRQEERIDGAVLISVALVATGVTLIAISL
ncbi:MAG: DMT family transporter [Acidimicrobiia bacterium]